VNRAGWIIFLFFHLALLPPAVMAGSRQDADEIVDRVLETYTLPLDREQVRTIVHEALEAGVPYEEVSVFMEALSTTDRPFDEIRSYLGTISEIHRSGTHSELVLNTILEGVVKGIPRERIEESLSAYRENLMFCRELALRHVGKKRADGERTGLLTDAAFITLLAGFDRSDVETLSRVAESNHKSPSYVIKTLEVAIELKNLGLGEEQAIELVSTAVSQDYTVYDLKDIPTLYLTSLKKGLQGDELYERLAAEIEKGPSQERTVSGSSGSSEGGSSSGKGNGSGGTSSGSAGSAHGTGKGKGGSR
jgi:uncharacterized membrane protein YgcG